MHLVLETQAQALVVAAGGTRAACRRKSRRSPCTLAGNGPTLHLGRSRTNLKMGCSTAPFGLHRHAGRTRPWVCVVLVVFV